MSLRFSPGLLRDLCRARCDLRSENIYKAIDRNFTILCWKSLVRGYCIWRRERIEAGWDTQVLIEREREGGGISISGIVFIQPGRTISYSSKKKIEVVVGLISHRLKRSMYVM